jgi:predicted N-acetyltransferase YhbS
LGTKPETYYPKFGYRQAESFGIEFPFNVPTENCMALELTKNGLRGVTGKVKYPKEFNG